MEGFTEVKMRNVNTGEMDQDVWNIIVDNGGELIEHNSDKTEYSFDVDGEIINYTPNAPTPVLDDFCAAIKKFSAEVHPEDNKTDISNCPLSKDLPIDLILRLIKEGKLERVFRIRGDNKSYGWSPVSLDDDGDPVIGGNATFGTAFSKIQFALDVTTDDIETTKAAMRREEIAKLRGAYGVFKKPAGLEKGDLVKFKPELTAGISSDVINEDSILIVVDVDIDRDSYPSVTIGHAVGGDRFDTVIGICAKNDSTFITLPVDSRRLMVVEE